MYILQQATDDYSQGHRPEDVVMTLTTFESKDEAERVKLSHVTRLKYDLESAVDRGDLVDQATIRARLKSVQRWVVTYQ